MKDQIHTVFVGVAFSIALLCAAFAIAVLTWQPYVRPADQSEVEVVVEHASQKERSIREQLVAANRRIATLVEHVEFLEKENDRLREIETRVLQAGGK